MTIQKSNILSELSHHSGTIGEIGGWLGVFLKTNVWYDVAMSVAAAIGRLESTLMDSESVKLGQVYKLDEITTSVIKGPYDDFLYRRYKQEIIE